ncbi:MAG: hypothetical protein A2381_06555 [Bdellovibrionales bacterium RIFOXYB1_FULL_37_110]|nr:MAG: hypothetical protein A2181_08575 [Bdellovibrionales bacterium RIFOXYA1_FULL_38_20]OFZ50202.1 MAG: hypothetical protein A2417_19405 [Bdellovibrionales bacterium RIFOXYC1_FULL_37_79]OFZ57639.1 MAG: hypothetical protein A2381_06555 [Bdellovibrionales bacterium RIFOXYB1_FULL_37_110]OFZ61406.1 MAG: hypothetical protein A2577_00920 [Bdellovibrionales bacterium RIFOXYD1_FULL_36_51]
MKITNKKSMHSKPKNNIDQDVLRQDALINECKGNLFEYLVGLRLSQLAHIEQDFHQNLDSRLKKQLKEYESMLRKIGPDILGKLMEFSKQTTQQIFPRIKENIVGVSIVGKMENLRIKEEFKEADLLVATHSGIIPISLKLSKSGAFVNTKSAGAKSFIEKYFSYFQDAGFYQKELNQLIERNYYHMGQTLYQMIGLDFKGEFDESWLEEGYSELPGQLPLEMKKIVQKNYQQTISHIYAILEKMSHEREPFARSLLNLIGLGHPDMLQVICFNKKINNGESYELESIYIGDCAEKMQEVGHFEMMPFNPQISSLEIRFPGFQLQIRIKPMNKFTTPSYKINCSVHYGVKHAKS